MNKTGTATYLCCFSFLDLRRVHLFFTSQMPSLALLLVFAFGSLPLQAQLPSITDSVFFYRDDKTPDQFTKSVTSPPGSFFKAADRMVSFPMGKKFAYCFLKIASTRQLQNQVLVIDNTSLDSVVMYTMQPNGTYALLYLGGNALAYNRQRDYVWHTAPVEIGPRPTIYLLAAKAAGQNINIRYALLPAAQLREQYAVHDRVISIYAGAVLLLLLVISIAGILLRKKFLLVYLGYITCFAGWIFAHYGYTFPLFYPSLPVINKIIKPLANLGSCIFFLQLLQLTFLQLLHQNRQLLKTLRLLKRGLCVIAASMLLLLLPGDHLWLTNILMFLWHLGVLLCLPLVVIIPFLYYRQNTTAKIFAFAVSVLVVTGILQVVTNFGFFYNYLLNEHGMMMASLLEITIIAVGLFYNVYAENNIKEARLLHLEMQQSETLKKLLTIQDTEQKRIANDLHDNIGPLLASLKINFGRILFTSNAGNQQELVAKTEAIINEAIAEIRSIAHDLMPKGLASKGLVASLNDYTISMGKLYRKTVTFSHTINNNIPQAQQLHIYRIICELVLNAAKHSSGNLVSLTVSDDGNVLHIQVYDNGRGFNKDEQTEKSFGLKSAESRISFLRGQLKVESIEGKGTTVMFDIPLAFEEAKIHSF